MIIGLIGARGSGKTLTMTKFLYNDYVNGAKIFTNYGLRFGRKSSAMIVPLDRKFFDDYRQSNFNINNASIGIDEAHVFIDSRSSMSRKNKMFSRFITQSRKRDVNLYYTTQDISMETFLTSGQVDLRLRKLTDYLVFCRFVKIDSNCYVVNEWYKQGLFMNRKVFHGNEYFRRYDTREIIDIDD